MASMILSAPRILLADGFSGPARLALEHGRITGIFAGPARPGDVHLPEGFVTPGLIDIHNNGAFGVDFALATPDAFDTCLDQLAVRGVTSVLPTIITAPLPDLHAAAARVAAAMARRPEILGLHLEGPFLSPAKRGAHAAAWLREPDAATLVALLTPQLLGVLRLVTLAPEIPHALDAIRRLMAMGVKVSIGHTEASGAETAAGIAAGATLATHVFNAMPPLHHRAPGAAGRALTDPRVNPCFIADGVHVDPAVLALAFAACERAIAVTDSISIAGLAPGETRQFGGAEVTVGADGAGYRADGTLAGAGITLDEGVRRLIAAGVQPATAYLAATRRPAEALGCQDRGRIELGARADLVWWGDDFSVRQVFRAGEPAAARPAPGLDELPAASLVEKFLAREVLAQAALQAAAPALARLAEAVAEKFMAGGRLFYAGAGTSGRLALLDAVECGPTFGVDGEAIIPLLAGGETAFLHAVEGAEDDTRAAPELLQARNFGPGDALIGIAASGSTPFTLAAVHYARAAGGLAGAIINQPGPIGEAAEFTVLLETGPEIITGSTRLAAGTAQKIALNTLSSTVMIRAQKVFGAHMVDLRASNAKLRRRAIGMTAEIAGVDAQAAGAALEAAHMQVKVAVLMLAQNCSAETALEQLKTEKGSLRRALKRKD